MITVDEVMTRDVRTLAPESTVADAQKIMTGMGIRHLPVVEDDNTLVGLVTQRDVLAATDSQFVANVSKGSAKLDDTPLSEIMTTTLATVNPEASLRMAALKLQKYKLGCLPVLEDNKLVGIITDSDYVAVAINLLEQWETKDAEELEDFN